MVLPEETIYEGLRGARASMLRDLLSTRIPSSYVETLTDGVSMKTYHNAFTSETADPTNNYQMLEQLGDLTINKFIVSYMYDRFPKLKCRAGVKVAARLRINYGSKQFLSKLANDLGFWPYVAAADSERAACKMSLLEDTFEAFVGATEQLVDERIDGASGYPVTHVILASMFDKIDISLAYEDLYDAKTRLKELFDMHGSKLGALSYKDFVVEKYRDGDSAPVIQKRSVIRQGGMVIGDATAALKGDAQQLAAAQGLVFLNTGKGGRKYVKPIPAEYIMFAS
jgi:dsRNA-specific ribonuclease